MLNSKEIMNELKKKLVGQDEYVRQLAILGYKHQLNQKLIEEGRTPINNNLLVVGPTGSGKTFGAKQLAKIVDIPFFEVDCSNIVQTGYRGTTSVEHILKDAVSKLGSKVQHSIIYLDEFDKVYDQSLDVRGEGTAQQQNFLKLLEPNELIFDRDTSSRFSAARRLDTSGITFIATGSFDFIRRKNLKQKQKMGFEKDSSEKEPISKEDIIKAGFIPELVGRFATLINLNELSEDDYYRILIDSKESAYTQYRDFFNAVDVDLHIGSQVFKKIAHEAYEKKVGARGLNDVLNDYLENAVFDVSCDPSISEIDLCVKNEEIVSEYRHEIKETERLIEEDINDREETMALERIRPIEEENEKVEKRMTLLEAIERHRKEVKEDE